jgi:hypothetical protein
MEKDALYGPSNDIFNSVNPEQYNEEEDEFLEDSEKEDGFD